MKRRRFVTELKVGGFILFALLVFAYITMDVSRLGLNFYGTYKIYTQMSNAEGVVPKTPVQVAGIPIGVVSNIELTQDQQAKLELEIRKEVQLQDNVYAEVRTRGVLGDTYIEIFPSIEKGKPLAPGAVITQVKPPVDYQALVRDLAVLTKDISEVTQAIKTYVVSEDSKTAHILSNIEILTKNFAQISVDNSKGIRMMVQNMTALSQDLRTLVRSGRQDIESTLTRVDDITRKLQNGEGTVGRLLNEDSTIEKTNEILDNVGDLTRSVGSLKTELGYRFEYLGQAGSVKSYTTFKIKPRPDKYFQFDVVYDSNPPASETNKIQDFNINGQNFHVETDTQEFNKLRFSAQLAKQFKDFTVRGGLIESSGGFGIDYQKGPVALKFDAFNLSEPHLKATAQLNVTQSLFMVGGVDDFTNSDQGFDWFLGAGLRFTDEDISSLIGGASLLLR